MSEHERTGKRDLAYSRWHRVDSFRRWLSAQDAAACGMIDLDSVEYCRRCNRVLALVEVCFDVGQFKATSVMRRLAEQAAVPAFVVYYRTGEDGDISDLRVGQVWPRRIGPIPWSPGQWARKMARLRREHRC